MIQFCICILLSVAMLSSVMAQEPPVTEAMVTTVVKSHVGAVGGVVTDKLGYVYVADFKNTVWRLDPENADMLVFASGFYGASGITLDKNGLLYQASFFGNSISQVSRSGEVKTVLDNGLNGPVGMVFNDKGELLICNCNDQSIKKLGTDGKLTDFAKSPDFSCPNGVAIDEAGNIYVVSFSGSKVVKVTPEGETSVFADSEGNGLGHIVYTGGVFYATSFPDNKVFRITSDGDISLFAGTGDRGQNDGTASESTFSSPNGIYADASGNYLYINDYIGDPNASGTKRSPFSVRRIELPSLTRILDYSLQTGSIDSMKLAHQKFISEPVNVGINAENAMNRLGWKYMGQTDYPEAVALFELNVEAHPESWRAYSSLGGAYMKVNENKKAIRVLQQSLQLNPDNMVARGRLVTLGAIEE